MLPEVLEAPDFFSRTADGAPLRAIEARVCSPCTPSPPACAPRSLAGSQLAKTAWAELHQPRRTARTSSADRGRQWRATVHRSHVTGRTAPVWAAALGTAELDSCPARTDPEASVVADFADPDARRQHHGQQACQGQPQGGSAEASGANACPTTEEAAQGGRACGEGGEDEQPQREEECVKRTSELGYKV